MFLWNFSSDFVDGKAQYLLTTQNYKELFVDEIYDYNTGSRRCFEKAGFKPYEKTEKGWKYWREL